MLNSVRQFRIPLSAETCANQSQPHLRSDDSHQDHQSKSKSKSNFDNLEPSDCQDCQDCHYVAFLNRFPHPTLQDASSAIDSSPHLHQSPLHQPRQLSTPRDAHYQSSGKQETANEMPSFHPRRLWSASVWLPFMEYFSQTYDYRCYAVSLRGHRGSWIPNYFQMVWRYGLKTMAGDLRAAIDFVTAREERLFADEEDERGIFENIVLVGHSAGGGLAQYVLSEMNCKVGGLVLIAAFPNFGGWKVYWNWFKLDPFFFFRFTFRDLGHPRSQLSSTSLVSRAFFSASYPLDAVQNFETRMPEYESLVWPSGMMFRFVKVAKVLRNIVGWRSASNQRMLVIAGKDDKLMGVDLMRQMAAEYRKARQALILKGALAEVGQKEHAFEAHNAVEQGVALLVIEGAHHVQNDLHWMDCADHIRTFIKKL